ncbi:MAG: LacI family transcriptional regulator [Candidatus Omnitrophica bacterium]|nr:LacI family transcriptional regulator [Candidatus Omnitrophota bacterium]MBU4590430.1 LacI family transcriptional regulator [Candidatus Omnitrophota bacterium]
MSKIINIKDVAREAGVSIATVSRVVNKLSTVKRSNKIRVERAVKKLKFTPNVSAQRLAAKSNNAIGLVIPRYSDIFHSFYALQILQGIGLAVERMKLDLLLHITDGDSFLNTSAVEGVIFSDIIGNEEQVDNVLEKDMPCVIMNYLTKDLPVSCVAIDNFNAAAKAVQYLIKLGHSKIATITGELKSQVAIDRLDGYLKTLEKNKIDKKKNYIKYGDFGRDLAIKATKELIDSKTPPTAIFAASDEMAVGAIQVLIENGINVPHDVSVIGFDDNQLALGFSPVPLTTMRQPLHKMAVTATETLYNIITKKTKGHKRIILPAELIERSSCQSLT